MKIHFAPIDARDGLCGYQTVAFLDEDWEHQYPITKESTFLVFRMEQEYLTRLYTLQREIASKYEAAMEELGESHLAPYGDAFSAADDAYSEEASHQAADEFPGPCAEWYD